jgi:hypothetical protein
MDWWSPGQECPDTLQMPESSLSLLVVFEPNRVVVFEPNSVFLN